MLVNYFVSTNLFAWLLVALFSGSSIWLVELDNLRNPSIAALLFAIAFTTLKIKKPVELLTNKISEEQLLKLTILISSVLFFKATLMSFYGFKTNGFDFTVFQHMIPSTLEGRFMDSPVSPGNHFAKHLTYIMFLLVPFQLIFKSSLSLILLHGALATGAVLIYEKWLKKLGYTTLQRTLGVMALTGFFLMGRFVLSDFRVESFYPILGFYFLYAFFNSSNLSLLIAWLLFVSVKEDAAIYAALFGIGALLNVKFWPQFLISEFKKQTMLIRASAIFVCSTLFFIINMKFVLPAMQDSSAPQLLGYLGRYGPSAWDFIWGAITHPLDVISGFSNSVFLTIAVCFLALFFAPLWCALPVLAFFTVHFLSSQNVMQSIGFYYSAPLIPFLFVGSSAAIKLLKPKFTNQVYIAHVFLCLFIGGGYIKYHRPPIDYSEVNQIKSAIVDDGVICMQASIMPHFGLRKQMAPLFYEDGYLVNDCSIRGMKYILLNTKLDPFPFPLEELKERIQILKQNKKYTYSQIGTFELFTRVDTEVATK